MADISDDGGLGVSCGMTADWRSIVLRSARRLALAACPVISPAIALDADLPPQPATASTSPASYGAPGQDWIVSIGADASVVPAWAGAPAGKFALLGSPLFG